MLGNQYFPWSTSDIDEIEIWTFIGGKTNPTKNNPKSHQSSMILNHVLTAKSISLFQTEHMHVVLHLFGGWEQNDEQHLVFHNT